MVRYCCVCKLGHGEIENLSFHGIPKKEELKTQWSIILARKLAKSTAICSRHFEESDFYYKNVGDRIIRFLLPDAVPAKFLHKPSKSEHQITENNDTVINLLDVKTEEGEICTTQISSHENILPNDQSETQNISATILKSEHQITENNDTVINLLDVKTEEGEICTTQEISDENILPNDQSETQNISATILKRKVQQPLNGSKRFANPRSIGDLCREDFTSDRSWQLVQMHAQDSKSKVKVLNQKVRRLSKKIESLQELLAHLKRNGLLSCEGSEAIEAGSERQKLYFHQLNCH